jgi:hypothetical protein
LGKKAKAGVSKGASFFSDYRKFMDRGNVIDLAVAVIIGKALFSKRTAPRLIPFDDNVARNKAH